MDMMVSQNLQSYIKDELEDSALYGELAKKAPNEMDRQLLLEFSEDEKAHAESFKKLYRSITGRSYNPEITVPELKGSYQEILRDRVLNESGDFRKYGDQYIKTTQNNALRDTYYRAHLDEGVHALRLLYMINKF